MGPVAIAALKPLFRYSTSRNAYVLRGIGQRFGPVLKKSRDEGFTRE